MNLEFSDLIQNLRETPVEILRAHPLVLLGTDVFVNDVNFSMNPVSDGEHIHLNLVQIFSGAMHENYLLYQLSYR